MKLAILLAAFFIGLSTSAWAANEKVCDSMGGNCVCSHSFQTPLITLANTGGGLCPREQDDAGKRCGEVLNDDGRPMFFIDQGGLPFVQNAPGLPPGVNAMELRSHSGLGIKLIAATQGMETFQGRVGVRQYVYYSSSPAYQSTNYGVTSCTNDKQMRIGDYWTAQSTGYAQSSTGGNYSPGPEQLRGKWVRLEMYVDNHQSPTRYDVYWKNITDNGPEYHASFGPRIGIYNAGNPCSEPGNPSSCHYPDNKRPWVVDGYREGNCDGYRRYAYVMMANWTTNSGQRIPPAVEIESGASLPPGPPPDSNPPTPPSGLRVSTLWNWMLTLLEMNG